MASTETATWTRPSGDLRIVTIVYKAHTDGSVQAVTLEAGFRRLFGWWLARARSWPTSGGTAPDAANVTVKDENGYDLFEGSGAGLIHATDPKAIPPLLNGAPALQAVHSDLVIAVAEQATNGAEFTLAFDFIKGGNF
jgi:hypothetical protein